MRPAACVVLLAIAASAQAGQTASPLRIAAADSYSRKCGGQALIVMQTGRTLHESYANGGAPDRPLLVMSLTKNLAALAIFAARASGLLSLDEPVAKTIAAWRDSPAKNRITIRELLNQTAGLADGYNAIYSRGVRDKNKIAAALPLVAEPGTLFDYAPGNYELLEEILRRKLAARHTDPLAFLAAKILAPLGIKPADDWRRDRAGNPFFSAGAKFTAPDLAKIGEFVRTRGRVWILPVLPASAFDGAFTGSEANSMYGFSFWLNANARRAGADAISIEGTLGATRSPAEWRRSCISSVAPSDLFAMVGSGGLRCYVVPSRKLVIVRVGKGTNFSDAEFLGRLFGR
ncbi:MAG: serine hydrolase domain-containing protein [Chthoniobacterales bacterium]